MSKICTIIPVYNEASRLEVDTFKNFLKENTSHSFIFVNDGSTDDSSSTINNITSIFPNQSILIELPKNMGKAEAIRNGMLYAIDKLNFDFLGFIDADLATPLCQIEHICNNFKTEKIICSIGSRVQLKGLNIDRKRSRHYLGRIFATYVGLTLKLNIYDTQCGAKYFRNPVLLKEVFGKSFISRWFFDIEIFIRLKQKLGNKVFNESVVETPLQKWTEKGNSKLKIKDFLMSPVQIFKIKRKYNL